MSEKISHSNSLLSLYAPYWALSSLTVWLCVCFAGVGGFFGPMRPRRFLILFTKLSSPTATSLVQISSRERFPFLSVLVIQLLYWAVREALSSNPASLHNDVWSINRYLCLGLTISLYPPCFHRLRCLDLPPCRRQGPKRCGRRGFWEGVFLILFFKGLSVIRYRLSVKF